MAAGFSGLFRTPVAAVFFALELFHSGVMEYDALLPAIVASLTATAVSGALGVTAGGVDLGAVSAPPTAGTLVSLAVLGAACGLAGVAVCHTAARAESPPAPLAAQPLSAHCAGGRGGGGAGPGHRRALQRPERGPACRGAGRRAAVRWDWLAKLCVTALCLAAGFQGGEVAPLFTIGAALGAVLAGPLGLPPQLAAALAYAGVFAAGTNTLIAPSWWGWNCLAAGISGPFSWCARCLCLQRRALDLPADPPARPLAQAGGQTKNGGCFLMEILLIILLALALAVTPCWALRCTA